MNITFVLPRSGSRPIGGFKVVYEYANELVRRGYRVRVIHAALLPERMNCSATQFYLKSTVRYFKGRLNGNWRPASWFAIDPRVDMRWVRTIDGGVIDGADVVVATHWATAEAIAALPDHGEKRVYLIQHFEIWDGPEDRVKATWRLPFTKVVIANWLRDIASEMNEASVYIPNGLDFDRFNCTVPIEGRMKSVAMMAHGSDWKGTADGVKAIAIAKEKCPTLTAELFGVGARPEYLPAWINYHQQPKQEMLKSIYNNAAIFVAPSWVEGWGLPPSEAMMCGAAIVGTNIGGHREFMQHNVTALLSPAREPELLAENILQLLADDAQRCAIAAAGNQFIQRFTWQVATDTLTNLFESLSIGSARGEHRAS